MKPMFPQDVALQRAHTLKMEFSKTGKGLMLQFSLEGTVGRPPQAFDDDDPEADVPDPIDTVEFARQLIEAMAKGGDA